MRREKMREDESRTSGEEDVGPRAPSKVML